MPIRGKRVIRPPGLDIQATAEIGASAKFEVKKIVTEHVPEDVTRAKSTAWLTILSPFTQWSGLIGDRLAHKRDLLRIQQEETLTAVMRDAAPRLALLKSPIEPVPVKFLIPFLEYASLEDPDSELVKLWANLLVSSAKNYNPNNVYYVRIISQMSSVQAILFEKMIGYQTPDIGMEYVIFLGRDFLTELVRDAFKDAKKFPNTLRKAWNILTKTLHIQGVLIEHIDLGHQVNEDYQSGIPSYSIYADENQNDYAILRGLGLIEYNDTGYFLVADSWKVKVMAYNVSSLGLAFAEACGVHEKRKVTRNK